jgi:hypothetical protein
MRYFVSLNFILIQRFAWADRTAWGQVTVEPVFFYCVDWNQQIYIIVLLKESRSSRLSQKSIEVSLVPSSSSFQFLSHPVNMENSERK